MKHSEEERELMDNHSIGRFQYKYHRTIDFINSSESKFFVIGTSLAGYIIVDITHKMKLKNSTLYYNKIAIGYQWVDGFNVHGDKPIFTEYEKAVEYISLKYNERRRVTDKAKETYESSLKRFKEFSSTMEIYRNQYPEMFV